MALNNLQDLIVRSALILIAILFSACIKYSYEKDTSACEVNLAATSSYADIKKLYVGETIQIQEPFIIEGYVSSSDQEGNFFNTLHFQNDPVLPTEGFQIDIELRDSYLFYPPGTKIFIKLKDLYLGKSKGVYKIGGVFSSFGNLSVGRLPTKAIQGHIIKACNSIEEIKPVLTSIEGLDNAILHSLIRIKGLEVIHTELGLTYAVAREETLRTLTNCSDEEIILLNSGYADFQNDQLPMGNGDIVGVLYKRNQEYQFIIRGLQDVSFMEDRCEELINEFTSDEVFISEIADPDNNSQARFIELHNASATPIDLNGWFLKRYTNSNLEPGASTDLSEHIIDANGTLVIASNAEVFNSTYGFPPEIEAGSNSPADSNGDDNLVLIDPFNTVIDIFGIIGEDGSGTNHEFEDGKAIRKSGIKHANPTFTFSEWVIYNDTGAFETIREPQNAPQDFSPGVHN